MKVLRALVIFPLVFIVFAAIEFQMVAGIRQETRQQQWLNDLQWRSFHKNREDARFNQMLRQFRANDEAHRYYTERSGW